MDPDFKLKNEIPGVSELRTALKVAKSQGNQNTIDWISYSIQVSMASLIFMSE